MKENQIKTSGPKECTECKEFRMMKLKKNVCPECEIIMKRNQKQNDLKAFM